MNTKICFPEFWRVGGQTYLLSFESFFSLFTLNGKGNQGSFSGLFHKDINLIHEDLISCINQFRKAPNSEPIYFNLWTLGRHPT